MNLSEEEVTKRYTSAYFEILDALNIKLPKIVKVTDVMNGIIKYIEKIYDKQYAYELDGDIYFDTTRIADYGVLSKRKLDEQISGIRVKSNENKTSPNDFVLWKKQLRALSEILDLV